ncbi:MAG: alpha/beta fold hydrolase [Bacteroidota bacterium]
MKMNKSIYYKKSEIHYQVHGKGDTLVLLHGFLENSQMWNNLLPFLVNHFSVITIDLFGHGKSESVGYIHTMQEMAKSVDAIIQQEKIQKAHILGHSMGGYVALEIVAQFPALVESMVLLNSSPLADTEQRIIERNRAIKAVKIYPQAFIRMAVKNLFLPELHETLKNTIDEAVKQAKTCSQKTIIATLEGLKSRKNHQQTLTDFKGKKLLIAGKKDRIVPYPKLKTTAKSTETPLVSLNGGHMTHIEFPDELKLILENFYRLSMP